MTCKDAIRLMCEYLEGKLAATVAGDVKRHLDRCKQCQIVLDAANKTLETYFSREPAKLRTRPARVA